MALARKLLTVAYRMLKHNEPYRDARPELMAEKFNDIRVKYVPKEPPGPSARLQSSVKQGLPAVYHPAGLPATLTPEQLPAGERRMLAERQLT